MLSNVRRYEISESGNVMGFDGNRRMVYEKILLGQGRSLETWLYYDCSGNIVHVEDSGGNRIWNTFTDGRLKFTCLKYSGKKFVRHELDSSGNIVRSVHITM